METLPLITFDSIPALLAEVPVVDGTYVVKIISRVLHILSAIVLVGGLFYIRTVLAPAGEEACYAGRRAVWARWVGIATLLLFVPIPLAAAHQAGALLTFTFALWTCHELYRRV